MINHYTQEDWQQYVKNKMDEETRTVLETHLYSCDQCLEHYLQAVEQEPPHLFIIEREAEFTNEIMAAVANKKANPLETTNEKKSILQSPIFHYFIAAAMTLVLMSSGVFHSLSQYVDTVQSTEGKSVTEGIMSKTFAWKDSNESKKRGGQSQ